MKTVLFLDYFFPPLLAAGRVIAFAQYLSDFGWQPLVLAADEEATTEKDYSVLQRVPQHVRVFRVGHREPPREWQALRRRLRVEMDFPDYYRSWLGPAYRKARALLRTEKVDLLCSASPTFTTAWLALRLKRRFGLPWVADMQDGWAVNDFLHRTYQRTLFGPLRALQLRRIRLAERAILTTADRTVAISWHVRERMSALHRIPQASIEVINDGYDEGTFRALTPRRPYPERPTITFLGSYYPAFERPVQDFLDAVAGAEPEAEVQFIGRAAAAVQAMNRPNVTCIMHLPHQKALSFGLGSDFLFVVMPDFARWIPTKLYDYLRLGRPVLALVPEDGDAARIVREARAGFVLPFDRASMRERLAGIFHRWRRGDLPDFRPDRQYIARYERRELTRRMAQVFDQVAA